ncbi:hypothetical protein [Methylobacterium sp. R2-1]|uniref:hypothetical protein n=1 Tax=Methylobacterium sp. R2-1 TaxID=2587064 RepID=UPI00161CBF80|nr:hypothetical protein [Methylobacterium sp. R2-1]MBB2961795.1 hypothetical protein [Methylobacterium sp. R2-1]
MTNFGKRQLLKYLGTIRGRGNLTIGNGQINLGIVSYEIDSYLDRELYSADGQIEGNTAHLMRAFEAGAARIFLSRDRSVEVVLADPDGSSAVEVVIQGRLPL